MIDRVVGEQVEFTRETPGAGGQVDRTGDGFGELDARRQDPLAPNAAHVIRSHRKQNVRQEATECVEHRATTFNTQSSNELLIADGVNSL